MKRLQKTLSIITLAIFLFGHVLGTPVLAAPSAPSAPEAPSTPSAPAPEAPKAPEAPSAPSENKDKDSDKNKDQEQDENKDDQPSSTPTPSAKASSTPAPTSTPAAQNPQQSASPTPTPLPSGNQTGSQTQDGNNGGASVNTGDATNTAALNTSGNNNLSLAPGASSGVNNAGPSLGIVNSKNGSDSTNSGSVSSASTNTTDQNNSAQVSNDLNQSTITGQNSASDNTGGNVDLKTGDANTTGTIVNSVNTNTAGVSVAEFNIDEDYVGDYVLDFAAGCISNCGPGSVNVANTGNGTESTNSGTVDINNTNETFQNNDATLENNLTLTADSGNNQANANTGGDVSLETGDASVVATVVNMINNNIAGKVIINAVNIAGNLVGDIILPKDYAQGAPGCGDCAAGDTLAANTKNGAGSENQLNVDQNTTNNTYQYNDANIENNLIIDASTAGNTASGNTNGDNKVETGDVDVDVNVLNVANTNVSGGVWWLVLVNEGGQWIGRIVGSPEGTNMAGSEGTEFIVNDQGEVVARNNNNGSDSTNTTNITQNNTNTTTQNNTANLVNNVNISANTGNNQANDNTGGNTEIKTGDIQVIENIINFVNLNVASNDTLIVNFINLLGPGKWIGNFRSPDATAQEIAEANAEKDKTQVAQGEPAQEEVVEEVVEEEPAQVEEEESADEDSTPVTTKKVKKTTAAASTKDEQPSKPAKSGGVLASAGTSIAQVAGVKIGPNLEVPDGAVVSGSKMKINLAWLVLALPLLILIALSRLRIAYYTRKIKNKLASQRVEGVVLGSLIAALIYLLNRVS